MVCAVRACKWGEGRDIHVLHIASAKGSSTLYSTPHVQVCVRGGEGSEPCVGYFNIATPSR